MPRRLAAVAVVLVSLVVVAIASAHIERASYWPNPAPDRSVSPPAGGKVPEPRSLASALVGKARGQTRVVCQSDSLKRLAGSILRGRLRGYEIRPHDKRRLGWFEAAKLAAVNLGLWRKCDYQQIQPAVTASGNNDRVVVMPGLYTEPTLARRAHRRPGAASSTRSPTTRARTGAVSYAYQFHCPNDQNLIAVIGRALGPGTDPVRRWRTATASPTSAAASAATSSSRARA